MPTKERYARGHRGNWAKRPHPERRRGPDILTPALPGQRSAVHNGPDAPADWGSDGEGDGSSAEPHSGVKPPGRNGGMRFYREIDVADREERESRGLKQLKYTWRTEVGPAPNVKFGDRIAAAAYVRKLDAAIEKGGWTSSEAVGLHNAHRVWSARAKGTDPRYAEVGNRSSGLTKKETANIEMRKIVLNMQQILESGRSNGN